MPRSSYTSLSKPLFHLSKLLPRVKVTNSPLRRIFPTHIRSQGAAFSMMGLYLADIIILVAGPIAFNKISWKFFFVLIVPTFFHIIFVSTSMGRSVP